MRSGIGRSAVLAVLGPMSCVACSFPSMTFTNADGSASTGGGSVGSTSSMSGAGGGASSGAGGATATSSGTAGGGGGGGTCLMTCDCDGDQHTAISCGGDDCADYDPYAYPGSTHFSEMKVTGPITTNHPWDYNCDGMDTAKYTNDACMANLCSEVGASIFRSASAITCGNVGELVMCNGTCPMTGGNVAQPCN